MIRPKVLVGLGNPGKKYANTRHNIGFMVIEKLAQEWGFALKEDPKFLGRVAKGEREGVMTYLLLPETYMNESGQAVRAIVQFYKLLAADLIVVYDDIALEFGSIRVKPRGSSGGHNGLKSIEQALGSDYYPRVRLGIGDEREGRLADHVLSPFTDEEQKTLSEFIDQAVKVVKTLVYEDIHIVMNAVNRRQGVKNERKEESL
jgi:PTH1 family peptidyl-tRNA hydrolase